MKREERAGQSQLEWQKERDNKKKKRERVVRKRRKKWESGEQHCLASRRKKGKDVVSFLSLLVISRLSRRKLQTKLIRDIAVVMPRGGESKCKVQSVVGNTNEKQEPGDLPPLSPFLCFGSCSGLAIIKEGVAQTTPFFSVRLPVTRQRFTLFFFSSCYRKARKHKRENRAFCLFKDARFGENTEIQDYIYIYI